MLPSMISIHFLLKKKNNIACKGIEYPIIVCVSLNGLARRRQRNRINNCIRGQQQQQQQWPKQKHRIFDMFISICMLLDCRLMLVGVFCTGFISSIIIYYYCYFLFRTWFLFAMVFYSCICI